MKLLLADDEKELTNAVVAILKHSNYTVDAVYNGTDALDYALTGDYDGIILDIMMPGMDGMEVLMVGEKTVTLSDPRNETVNHMLDISDILKSQHDDGPYAFWRGYHVLEIEYDRKADWGDYTYQETERQNFLLTDLAMVAASASDSGGGITVFVRSISSGKPVADAEVELTTSKNQFIIKLMSKKVRVRSEIAGVISMAAKVALSSTAESILIQ